MGEMAGGGRGYGECEWEGSMMRDTNHSHPHWHASQPTPMTSPARTYTFCISLCPSDRSLVSQRCVCALWRLLLLLIEPR